MPTDPLLAAALEYASHGLRVVLLHSVHDGVCSCRRGADCGKSAGKHPRFGDWQKTASADPAVIAEWWAIYPGANVGVLAGGSSGVVGIDIDSADGEALHAELCGGKPVPTWEMRTGNGRRLIYRVPEGCPETRTVAFKDAAGNESVRLQGGASGAQFVMPPSWHYSGRRYEWKAGHSPADGPPALMADWLRVEMTRPPDPPTADTGAADLHLPGADFNRRADWWKDILEPAGYKPAGGRDQVKYYTRPGKAGGVSVTVGHYAARDGTPALFVFSGSIPELRAGKAYDKFGAVVRLGFKGDFAAATRQLTAAGFGSPPRPPSARPSERPTASTGSVEPWPEPVPLSRADGPPVPFPLNVLPPSLGDFVASVAAATNTPVDYAAAFLVGVSAGLIGATLAVRVTDNWSEPAVLYTCVVAPPSAGKSPALSAIMRPVYRLQAERAHRGEGGRPYAADLTVEGLAPVLKDNPRGLLVARDELSSWAASFNQYKARGGGADRQFWLANWSGEPWDVTRKNPEAPHLHVPYTCVSVTGGIQPAVVETLRGGADDGFMERLLFSYPDPLPSARLDRRPYVNKDEWKAVVGTLFGLQMEQGEYGMRPRRMRLTAEAERLFDDWTGEVAAMNNDGGREPGLEGVRKKMTGLAARLSLLLHALWRTAGSGTVGPEVEAEDVERGVRLARYFLAHSARVHGLAAADPRVPLAGKVLDWVARKKPETFTRRDVYAALRRSAARPEDLVEPLKLLVQLGHLRYADVPAAGTGRPRGGAVYEVYPRPRTHVPETPKSP